MVGSKIFGVLVLFVFFEKNTECFFDKKINFIKDFVVEKFFGVNAFICWKNAKIVELSKTLWSTKLAVFGNSNEQEFFKNASPKNLFLVDLDNCSGSWAILEKANQGDFFNHPFKWMVLTNFEDDYKHLSKIVNKYEILPGSEFFVVNGNETTFKITQPYKTKSGSFLVWENFGFWTKNLGLVQYYEGTATAERRRNLQRAKLGVSLYLNDYTSVDHLEDFKYPRVDSFSKQDWGAIKSVLDYCNVEPDLIIHDSYGYYNPTLKRWDGIIHLLERKGSQMSNTIFFTLDRLEVVDFIKMVNPLQIRFLLRKPAAYHEMNIFVVAFRDRVWISIGTLMVFFGIALLLALNIENSGSKKKEKQKTFTGSDVVLILLEAIGQQGSATYPKGAASKILFIVLFMAFMFLFVAYSAYILVLLQSTKTINNWYELANSNMEVGVYKIQYMYYYMSNLKIPIQKQIYESKIGPDGYYNLETGMDRVKNGFFAYYAELGAAYNYASATFTDEELCSLQELIGFYEQTYAYVPIPKKSPYKEIFKTAFYKVDEYGLQRRHSKRYNVVPKIHQKNYNFGSVGLIACYQSVVVLAIGVLLALTILAIEKIVYNYKLKYQ